MSTPHDSAQSLMKLYDLRREAKLREARDWVIRSFNPKSVEDVAASTQSDEYVYVRMVTGLHISAHAFRRGVAGMSGNVAWPVADLGKGDGAVCRLWEMTNCLACVLWECG